MIILKDIKKEFQLGQQKVKALKGINLEVDKSDFVSIMGPSGSGKTTLMNIVGCLDTPSSGNYYLNNQLVSELDEDSLARIRNKEIGFVFQSFHLLAKNSALDNVLLPMKYAGTDINEATERAKYILEQVGLSDRINHGPSELSGGQQQRVAIARAIITKPSLILADEPTGNLDEEASEIVENMLFDLNRELGTALVVVTHDLELAKKASHVFRLKGGKLVKNSDH